jgi:hypothetical protein
MCNIDNLVAFKIVGDPKEPCPLILDIECYPYEDPRSQELMIEDFLHGLETICSYLGDFLSKYLLANSATRKMGLNDFFVEDSCGREEGGKMSGHITCTNIAFEF